MKLVQLRLSNFRSFGPEPSEIDLDDMTFLLGPNGAGKTAVLQALARMFSIDPAQRKIRASDFHFPYNTPLEDLPEERELWIEADFQFPELAVEGDIEEELPAVPGNFAHMQLATGEGPAVVRYRLRATIDRDDYIEEWFTYVTREDEEGRAIEESRASKQDRNAIQVHYLPARRNPADHISYSANALLGRLLRSADWSNERVEIAELTEEISDALVENTAVDGITQELAAHWGNLHKGSHFANPSVSFGQSEMENLLRHLSVAFTPGHAESIVDFTRLSDGQQSLLYIALVLAAHGIGGKVLDGELAAAFDIEKLRPAVFTLIAVEEPENSLSPHYLGRVVKSLTGFATGRDSQSLLATHSPSLLRRVPPEHVRYLRLNDARATVVKSIKLPEGEAALKFVREGVQAFPELYFSRFVVLGEGDSEEIVLPRLLAARGILADDASVSVVPLGGRHVNHLWRLLHGLGIPHVTLLDLDLARYQGGWGRVKYAAKQLLAYSDISPVDFTQDDIDEIPSWHDEQGLLINDDGWIERLEQHKVFFSSPLDLDFMMLESYPEAYKVEDDELEAPDGAGLKAVLGKQHDEVGGQYSDEQLEYFEAYHKRFKLGSKPTWHVRGMAGMDDQELLAGLPAVLGRMFDEIASGLEELPE